MPSALVTGASRGIGAAIARRLATDGFDVAVHYHAHEAGAHATAEAVRAAGRQAVVLQADLTDAQAAWAVAEDAASRMDDLRVVVNNAGIYVRESLDQISGESWGKTIGVNLDAPAAIVQALAPRLGAGASVVHISSIVAMRGSTHGAHYAAAKAGLLGLTRAQALELAPAVRVNAVCPGYIDTDILAGDSSQRRARREQEVPLGRVGSPDDVAGVVSWLCGPDAAYVTGQAIHVNGGLWMG